MKNGKNSKSAVYIMKEAPSDAKEVSNNITDLMYQNPSAQ